MDKQSQTGADQHITVCINTYKRRKLLGRLLECLARQETEGQFNFSVVIVDNDRNRSAREVAEEAMAKAPFEIEYHVESERNIALARNRAVGNARGNLVAFIDDDEIPVPDWLLNLYKTMRKYGSNGAFGPVRPHFDEKPPGWLIRGRFCERPEHPTGTILDSPSCRTGNALVDASIFNRDGARFDPVFGKTGGEDGQFFLQQIQRGKRFVWSNEAIVHEVVPRQRWTRSYYLKRKSRIGGMTGEIIRKRKFRHDPVNMLAFLGVSSMYVLANALLLPFSLLAGQAVFLKVLLKFAYSGSILAGFFGLVPFRYREEEKEAAFDEAERRVPIGTHGKTRGK